MSHRAMYLGSVSRGFAQTDRGMASAGAGTIGTELNAEQHFASSADVGDTNVGLIRREALLTLTLSPLNNSNHHISSSGGLP